jgi:hypothetical protein
VSEPVFAGVARLVGSVSTDQDSIPRVLYGEDIELYRLDPPLSGYPVVAAGQSPWAMRASYVGDPTPPEPEDPVSTHLFGTTGGEGLQIQWANKLYRADGKAPARALAELGYRLP